MRELRWSSLGLVGLVVACQPGDLTALTGGALKTATGRQSVVSSPSPASSPAPGMADRLAALLAGQRMDVLVFEDARQNLSASSSATVGQELKQAALDISGKTILQARAASEADDAFQAYVELQAQNAADGIKCLDARCHPLQGAPLSGATASIAYGKDSGGIDMYGNPFSPGFEYDSFYFVAPSTCSEFGALVDFTYTSGTYQASFSAPTNLSIFPVKVPQTNSSYSITINSFGRDYGASCAVNGR